MTKKECIKLIEKYFGPASAKVMESMEEEEVISKTKEKIKNIFGDNVCKKEFGE